MLLANRCGKIKRIKIRIMEQKEKEGKEKLLVSFSGGETSAFMAQWLLRNKTDKYEMIFVFANTGQENEETLEFAHWCDREFGLNLIWIEAHVYHNQRKSNGFKEVDFYSASRNGEPFEEIIKKHGIPNAATPHCTRELKQAPIKSYAKSLGWKNYKTAIGIRIDEIDRVNEKASNYGFVYPLVSMIPMAKQKINFYWSQQIRRLNLKGYQGNCLTCWKKSRNKLLLIAKESPEKFNFMQRMESKYGDYIPKSRIIRMKQRGVEPAMPITFFRKKESAKELLIESLKFDKIVLDDSIELDQNESCEVFSNCGDY